MSDKDSNQVIELTRHEEIKIMAEKNNKNMFSTKRNYGFSVQSLDTNANPASVTPRSCIYSDLAIVGKCFAATSLLQTVQTEQLHSSF